MYHHRQTTAYDGGSGSGWGAQHHAGDLEAQIVREQAHLAQLELHHQVPAPVAPAPTMLPLLLASAPPSTATQLLSGDPSPSPSSLPSRILFHSTLRRLL